MSAASLHFYQSRVRGIAPLPAESGAPRTGQPRTGRTRGPQIATGISSPERGDAVRAARLGPPAHPPPPPLRPGRTSPCPIDPADIRRTGHTFDRPWRARPAASDREERARAEARGPYPSRRSPFRRSPPPDAPQAEAAAPADPEAASLFWREETHRAVRAARAGG